jgi:pimeloyl-ACP methyl ester carboxylesterase
VTHDLSLTPNPQPVAPSPSVTTWGHLSSPPVLLVHGSNTPDPERTWRYQRELADSDGYRLLVLHRRGYGKSQDVEKPDFEIDVNDILSILEREGGAHLVGFSYGGVLSLLATARRPDLVRTLTLIEPPAYAVARGNPVVDDTVERMLPLFARTADGELPSPETFIRGFRAVLGITPADPGSLSAADQRGIRGSLLEPPPSEAEIPLDRLAHVTRDIPKLIATGAWNPALDAVADVLEARLPAERIVIPGAGHSVHYMAEAFNTKLREVLGRG